MPLSRRTILPWVAATATYGVLALSCAWLGQVTDESFLEALSQTLRYTFFLLGPPATLIAGRDGLQLFILETALLAVLLWQCARVRRQTSRRFAGAVLITLGYWLLCGYSVVIFAT